jgi:hypothetical protein
MQLKLVKQDKQMEEYEIKLSSKNNETYSLSAQLEVIKN